MWLFQLQCDFIFFYLIQYDSDIFVYAHASCIITWYLYAVYSYPLMNSHNIHSFPLESESGRSFGAERWNAPFASFSYPYRPKVLLASSRVKNTWLHVRCVCSRGYSKFASPRDINTLQTLIQRVVKVNLLLWMSSDSSYLSEPHDQNYRLQTERILNAFK